MTRPGHRRADAVTGAALKRVPGDIRAQACKNGTIARPVRVTMAQHCCPERRPGRGPMTGPATAIDVPPSGADQQAASPDDGPNQG